MQIPIITVMGNHEYYRHCLPDELAKARRVAPLYGVNLLEDDTVVLGGLRFLGCTLFTDYAIFGEANISRAMRTASDGLNDHRKITWTKKPEWLRFRPAEALMLHKRSRAFIESELAKPFDGATVIVTHHAPHPCSMHSRYGSDLLSAAYVSDLTAVIETGQPNLWVHGHVHENFDYQLGATRVACNPHGYGAGVENPKFDPGFVLEIGS